jgi:FSR family fosmidomycin resistance protein-like MFS transporter
VILGLAFLALGFAPGFWAILAALFFAGLGSSVQHPLGSTIISHAYAAEGRRAALGTYNFAGDVGKFAFGATVSLLLLAGISWQAPVVGFGLVALLAGGAVLVLVSDTRPSAQRRTEASARAAGWGIRDRQGFTVLCLIEILDSSTRAGFLTFIAFLLIEGGLSAGWAASAVPLVFVGGMAGKLACGLLAERFGVVRMIVITEVATACGIFAVLALPAGGAFLLLPLLGVVLQGTSSVLYATVGEFVEPARLPRTFGFFYTIGSICGIAAPLGYGLLGDRFGVDAAIAIMGVLVLLTLPLAALLKPRFAAAPQL